MKLLEAEEAAARAKLFQELENQYVGDDNLEDGQGVDSTKVQHEKKPIEES